MFFLFQDANTEPNVAQEQLMYVRYWLVLLLPLLGALILFGFNYLYQKGRIKDKSLDWLGVSLLSWSALGFLNLIWNYVDSITSLKDYLYLNSLINPFVSALSNVVFVITAVKLIRVRELIKRNDLFRNVRTLQFSVIGISVIVFVLQMFSYSQEFGNKLDPVISLVSLSLFGTSITYSFYRYGNNPFAVLTVIDFLYFISYQFYSLYILNGIPTQEPLIIVVNILSVVVFTFLCISLTLSWSLSNTSRNKFIRSFNVNIVAMAIDLRGSTAWTIKHGGDLDFVVNFKNMFSEWILNFVSIEPYGNPFLRFTGDGYMLVWETPKSEEMDDLMNAIVGLGYSLHEAYPLWVKNKPNSQQTVPKHIGVGIDCGVAIRLTSENGAYDYEGIPVSCAAKLQNLSRPVGGVTIREKCKLSKDLRKKFPKRGHLKLGDLFIPTIATKEVQFEKPLALDE